MLAYYFAEEARGVKRESDKDGVGEGDRDTNFSILEKGDFCFLFTGNLLWTNSIVLRCMKITIH